MPIFGKRSRNTLLGYYISSDGDCPPGYDRLLDSPEISTCINRITAIISSATLYIMQNSKAGDVRVRNGLSRFLDIDPWPGHGTRQSWMAWIVSTMLGDGDGNAYVLPRRYNGKFEALEPMPGAFAVPNSGTGGYYVHWNGRSYGSDEILHFRLFPDPQTPYMGRGCRVQAKDIAGSLQQAARLKKTLGSPKYKPPMIVSVNSDSDLSDDNLREEFRRKFLEDADAGKPWIIPASLMSVTQAKPLTLADLAISDTVKLDKAAAASIYGVPPFLLGIGAFSQAEYNNFVRTVIIPICVGIEQELTLKLLYSEEMFIQFNRRRLYAYDLKDLINIDLAMSDRGFLTGDEVREDSNRDPAGLDEFRVLENYIPWDMAGLQNKLKQEDA